MTNNSNSLIKRFQPNPQAVLRLFCFPYAGGSAAIFRKWVENIPQTIELCAVEFPGRISQIQTSPLTRIEPLVDAIATALLPYLDKPFAFFGHSMGALVSFEVARLLQTEYNLKPGYLFISGRQAPQIPPHTAPIHNLPEPEFLAQLRRLNGTPAVLLENAELMQILIPILRADFAVLENYTYIDKPPLNCAIAVDETQEVAKDQQTEQLLRSAFVLPDSETPEIATDAQISAEQQATKSQLSAETGNSQPQVASAPVSPPASAEVASVTLEVVSSADGSSIAEPEPEYHVKPGDTLSAIATEHKTSVPEIVSANQLQDPNLLLVNQRIVIPSLVDKKKVEKVTVAMLPEIEPAMATNVPAPVLETNAPNPAILVAANSSNQSPTDLVNQSPANSYNGIGGSTADEVEAPKLTPAQIEQLQAQYAQKLQNDVQKLQHKYYAQNNSNLSAQAVTPRLPAVTKPPVGHKLSDDEPVNPEFVVAQTARDLNVI